MRNVTSLSLLPVRSRSLSASEALREAIKAKRKQFKMSSFENSWETLDKARNPDKYETMTTADGKEVTFLKGESKQETKPRFTKEEEENIARACAQMQDRDD